MDKKEKIVVVTWDFTEISEFALAHAERYATVSGAKIHCLHISNTKQENTELQKRLEKEVNNCISDKSLQVEAFVKRGKIFSTINDYANSIKAELIIMGTHGRIGSQKVFGSKSLKVIVGSKIPFLTVQRKPVNEFKELVLPFDSDMEGREKMKWVVYFAKKYQLKVRILKKVSGIKDIQKVINNNITFAKRVLFDNDIAFEVDIETNMKDFPEETIQFANNISAGLIMVMTTKNIGFTDYMFGAKEQKIIANKAKIPVICINPRTDLMKPASFY
ncbi:MAG: universal stress protein [Bacteroidota bacterium]|nr:universal stress protein [Bacteroidota bacterium]